MLARFRASSPDRCPQAAKSPCHASEHGAGGEKATAFRGRTNKTAPPCETLAIICYLATVRGNSCNETSQRNILRNTRFSASGKGGSTLLYPSLLQLPRCLVRICNLFLTNHKIADLTVSKMQLQQGKTDCKIEFNSQNGLLAHTSAFFENRCTKNF